MNSNRSRRKAVQSAKPGGVPKAGWTKAMTLNSVPMPVRPVPVSRSSAASISARSSREALVLSIPARSLDAEAAQEQRLRNRAEDFRAHRLGPARQRLKVDMRGEVDRAGAGERVGVSVARDRLQRVTDGAFAVAVIDHQCGTAVAGDTPAEIQSHVFRAPFKN